MSKNAEWLPMETAPRDGTPIQADIPGNGKDNIIRWEFGLLDSKGEGCGGWCFVEDQDYPDCWTDGICWEENEDGNKSVYPVAWKPIP